MSNKRLHKLHRRHKLRRTVAVTGVLLVALLLGMTATALNTDDVKAMTALYDKYDMPRNNMISYIGRLLGWMLIQGLSGLVSMIEQAVWQIGNLFGGFATGADAQALIQRVALLGAALFVFVVLYIGWQAMNNKVKWAELAQNVLLSLVVLLILPTAMVKALTLTQQMMAYIKGDSSTSVTEQLVSNNVIDITGYDTPGSFGANGDVHPSGDAFGGDGISIVDMIDPDDYDKNGNKEVYNQYVDNGELKEVNKAEFFGTKIEIFSTQYYRYKVNWLPVFVSLLVSGVAFLFSGVKIARLLYELAINQMLATLCAWLDVHSGQRLKKCLQTILATFFTLCGVYLCFSFYIIGQAYIAKWPIMPQLIAMLALAWALVDGPNLFEKIIGVDVGLQDGLRTMYGLRAASNIARSVGRGVIGTRMADGHRVGGLINRTRDVAGLGGRVAATTAEAGGRVAGNIAGRIQGQRPVQPIGTTGARSTRPASATHDTPRPSAIDTAAPMGDTTRAPASSDPVFTGADSAPAADTGVTNNLTDTARIEQAAAASVDTAREAADKDTDTRQLNRTDEVTAPVSMSEYIRDRANRSAPVSAARQIGSSAARGFRQGKDLRQGKAQRRMDNARTPLGAEKIQQQTARSSERYVRSQQQHQALRDRQAALQARRDAKEATSAYKWLDKHAPEDIKTPPVEYSYREERMDEK